MIETELRTLFADIASEPARSGLDTERARRRGRARLRWRRAGLAGAPVLAAAAVAAVVLIAGAGSPLPGPGPAATPAAPRQFDPLAPYASFGWLPAGQSLAYGDAARTVQYLLAGPSAGDTPWLLQVYPDGRCRLTGPARTLTCGASPKAAGSLKLGRRAAMINGHPAFWARLGPGAAGPGYPVDWQFSVSWAPGPAPVRTGYLAWQYARAGWAVLGWQEIGHGTFDWRPQAVRIAGHVRFGAHAAPPLAFPAQLTGGPATWQVSSDFYVRDGAVLRAFGFTLSTDPAGYPISQSQFGLPDVRFNLAARNGSCPRPPQGKTTPQVINGHRVTVSHYVSGTGIPEQMLCAPHAAGLTVVVTVQGKYPARSAASVFAHHLRLFGTNPAHWARKPIG
jgi:hypothetical protein